MSKKILVCFRVVLFMTWMTSSACAGLPGSLFPGTPSQTHETLTSPTKTVAPELTAVLTFTPAITMDPQRTKTALPLQEITIWLPPEFDPSGSDKAAKVLSERIAAFEKANTVKIKIRLKATNGTGSLLESLNAAAAAAPRALPGLVALSRPDLETAALNGLLVPLDGAVKGEDWFDYARPLSQVQGATFGTPFAGDVLVVIYRPAKTLPPPSSWDNIVRLNQPFAFPVASQQALTTLTLYQSIGGEIQDTARRPILQVNRLALVFSIYRQAADHAVLPIWLTQYDTEAQVWQTYQDNRANAVLTWLSYYLVNPPQDSTIIPLPALNGGAYGLATSWNWAVTDPIPERRVLSIRLANWLSDSAFLAGWNEAMGFLPTRPSSLDARQDGNLKAVLRQIALSAHPRPANDLVSSLGPVLREASLSVIRLENDPDKAASNAVNRIYNQPQP